MGRFLKVWLLAMVVFTLCESLKVSKLQLESNTMSKCLSDLIEGMKVINTLTLRIRVEAESQFTKWMFGDIIDSLVKGFENIAFELDANEPTSYRFHGRIYFVDSVKSLEHIITWQREWQPYASSRSQGYFIILPPVVQDSYAIIKQIIEVCWKHFIVDVFIFYEDAYHTVKIYTYYPFNKDRCRDLTPVIHNSYVNGRFEFENHLSFPTKVDNFWQCPFKVITWHNPPYFSIDRQRGQVSGMEAKLLGLLAATANFTIEIIESPPERSQIFQNGTTTGALGMLENRDGDFFIGETDCATEGEKLLSATVPYYAAVMTVVVKQPEQYLPLEILLFPFDWYTWLILLIVFMVKWICRLLFRRITLPFREYSTRLCVMSWLFSILILRSSYEGSVFDFFQNNPRKPLPNSLEEAVLAGYTIICPGKDQMLLTGIPAIEDNLITYETNTYGKLEEFRRLKGKYAMVILKEYLSVYKFDSSKYQEFIILPKAVISDMDCMYLPKFSYLTQALNHRLFDLREHGHIKKIRKETLGLYNIKNKVQVQEKAVSLPLNHLLAAFHLYGLLLAISVLILMLELLARRNRKVRNFLNFFH